jgi:hypothetical protein
MADMKLAFAVLVVLTAPVYAQIGVLSPDAEIRQAIQDGEANRFERLATDCTANAGMGSVIGDAFRGGIEPNGGFSVIIGTNRALIAGAAFNAKKLYRRISPSELDLSLTQQSVAVVALPEQPRRGGGNSFHVASPIQHIVLKSRSDASVVIQPERVLTEPVIWSNLLGGSVESNKATAYFHPQAIDEIPRGDFDVVLITFAGERKCKIGNKDRVRVFGR